MFNNSPRLPTENRAVFEINVEKYGTDRQTTDDKIILRMRFAFWINKATHKLSICRLQLKCDGTR